MFDRVLNKPLSFRIVILTESFVVQISFEKSDLSWDRQPTIY